MKKIISRTRLPLAAIAALLLSFFISRNSVFEYAIIHGSIDVTILNMHGIPSACNDELIKSRSSSPQDWPFNFCGGIFTSMGPFLLPESRSFNPFLESR